MNTAASPSSAHARPPRGFARVALGFWSGPTRGKAIAFTAGLLACVLLNLGLAIGVNRWNKFFFDALQNKDQSLLLLGVALIAVLAVLSAAAGVLQLQARMRLQLRWREWLTQTLVRRWMEGRRFYQLNILDIVDNPEARMSEDGRVAVELFVDFATGVTNAVLAAASFVGVLWIVGGSLAVWGVTIPGYMVIAALIYSALTSLGMFLLGRPLVARVEAKAEAEADFRYELTRVRENAETIALIGGDDDERDKVLATFGRLASRWLAIIGAQARMLFLSSGNNILAPVVPLLLGAPKFLSGEMTLGDLMQAAAAFAQVQMALNWLADNSLRLADWFASARRVSELDASFEELDRLPGVSNSETIDLGFSDDGSLRLVGLCITQHDGKVMLADAEVRIERGEKVLVTGDSGAGKSTLIRAMAGLWPWGSGRVERPRDARVAFMPQRPYLPLGTLRAALDYPQDDAPLDPANIDRLLAACGLEHLVPRLDEDTNWSNVLSGGEQQRFAFARLFLKQCDVIIMDEPTSALDELGQTRMMELLREEAPDAMVLHVAHRPGLKRFHDREIHLKRVAGGPAVVEEAPRGLWRLGRGFFGKGKL